jgi:hypothetical protein
MASFVPAVIGRSARNIQKNPATGGWAMLPYVDFCLLSKVTIKE